MQKEKVRCGWAGSDPLNIEYHDTEWGVPCRDDGKLFEFLILEGAQAGLSWTTILRKRQGYRAAFDGFDVDKVARYRTAKVEKLLSNPAIVRNRLKIESVIINARRFLEVRDEFGRFADYLWRFVDGQPVQNQWTSMKQVPASSRVSDAMSKDLKKRGFKFVGTTICYAYMQAMGLVNDHTVDCYRHRQIQRIKRGHLKKHKSI